MRSRRQRDKSPLQNLSNYYRLVEQIMGLALEARMSAAETTKGTRKSEATEFEGVSPIL